MSPILYAIPLFLLLIGVELLAARWMGRKVYRLHDAVTSMNIGIISDIVRSMVKLLTVVIYALVAERAGALTFDLGSPYVWVLAFFMYDFGYYWAHRAGHEVNLLWAAHVVHHSSEEFNLSTALRQSSTNTIFYWVFYLPMALVGIPVTVFVAIALASALYQFWVHTRLIPKLGWVDRVFMTPSNHRCHHGRNPYCIDVNYGATLAIWDRLFGTYVEERDDEPVVYGTLIPLHSWNPVWANCKNYLGIWRAAVQAQGWKTKLMCVFAHPGWTPDSAPMAKPETDAQFTLFETPSSKWQEVYGVFACTVIFLLFIHLLMVANDLGLLLRIVYGLVVALTAICLGRVFAGKPRAIEIEGVRAVLVLGAVSTGIWFAPLPGWAPMVGAAALLVTLALLALMRSERVNLQPSARTA